MSESVSDPRGAPTEIGSEPVVIQKTRYTSSGWKTSLYACGPVRETMVEAKADAGAFARILDLETGVRKALKILESDAPLKLQHAYRTLKALLSPVNGREE